MNDLRLVYRAMIQEGDSTFRSDLRVLANEHGLLRIYLEGVARDIAYAGIDPNKLPASVAEGGYTNEAIAERVRKSITNPKRWGIASEWVEPNGPYPRPPKEAP